jgi:hypothetical protein
VAGSGRGTKALVPVATLASHLVPDGNIVTGVSASAVVAEDVVADSDAVVVSFCPSMVLPPL